MPDKISDSQPSPPEVAVLNWAITGLGGVVTILDRWSLSGMTPYVQQVDQLAREVDRINSIIERFRARGVKE